MYIKTERQEKPKLEKIKDIPGEKTIWGIT